MGVCTAKYGNYYWCVKTSLSSDGELYLMADRAEVVADGSLLFWTDRTGDQKSFINFAIAPGNWKAFYAVSLIDGRSLSVEHWQGREPVTGVSSKRSAESLEDIALRLVDSKGTLTVRQLVQCTKRLNCAQAKDLLVSMVASGSMVEEKVGKAYRYRLAE